MTTITAVRSQIAKSTRLDRWSLPRVLMFVLANAFFGLMIDIRTEHVDAVHERGVAWLPIVYSGVMAIACLIAVIYWGKTARRLMLPLFLLAFVIGGMGFYFHNEGQVWEVLRASLAAWTDPKITHSDGPPPFAPLAFAGLGALGVLASAQRFNSSGQPPK
jgi:hypothetical protein